MHRLILLSSAYRQASTVENAAAREKDPDNRLLWRFSRRRLEAEEIRDAMLAVSGQLNAQAGGPSVIVPVDPDLVHALYKPSQWAVAPDPAEHDRRSVYLIAKRNLRLPFMEVFDAPDALVSCPRRESSTHAPQALELLNGDFANQQAEAFAGAPGSRSRQGSCASQVDLAYRLAAGRAPNAKEKQLALEFLKTAAGARPARIRPRDVQPECVPVRELIMPEHIRITRNRREFLCDACCGFGGLAFASMLQREDARAATLNPLAPKAPAHARQGQSQVGHLPVHGRRAEPPRDVRSQAAAEQARRPEAAGRVRRSQVPVRQERRASCSARKRTFQQATARAASKSPTCSRTSAHAIDDIAVIRSCHGDMVVHSAAQYQLFTGRVVPGFPSMGSWVIYGLGSESESLPAYVVMPDPKGALEAGQPMYTNGFLPAVYQPTMFRPGGEAGAESRPAAGRQRWRSGARRSA